MESRKRYNHNQEEWVKFIRMMHKLVAFLVFMARLLVNNIDRFFFQIVGTLARKPMF